MFIDRKTLEPDTSIPVVELRDICMGCADCKGACLDLIQLFLLPDILVERREKRS